MKTTPPAGTDRGEKGEVIRLGNYDMPRKEAINKAVEIICNPVDLPQKPWLESVKTIELYCGGRVTKFAVWGICDDQTGESKGKQLTVKTIDRIKARGGWEADPKKSITIDDDAIDILRTFLCELPNLPIDGEFLVINADDVAVQLLNQLTTQSLDVGLISSIVAQLANPENIAKLSQLPSDELRLGQSLAAALNYVRMSQVLDEFEQLVKNGCGECDGCKNRRGCYEQTYQRFLEEHYWIFGSEYSELIPNRRFIKNKEVDFPLRRTVDGYLEVIEIKKPMEDLFTVHNGKIVAESPAVAKAKWQVSEYLSSIDIKQNDLRVEDDIDVEKVRGKVIIGRIDGDDVQTKALRQLNALSTRIEVITYDQLISTAERILDILSPQQAVDDNENDPAPSPSAVDDIPF